MVLTLKEMEKIRDYAEKSLGKNIIIKNNKMGEGWKIYEKKQTPEQELLRLIKHKGVGFEEVLEHVPTKTIREIIQHLETYCVCGNCLKEHEIEGGFCDECR